MKRHNKVIKIFICAVLFSLLFSLGTIFALADENIDDVNNNLQIQAGEVEGIEETVGGGDEIAENTEDNVFSLLYEKTMANLSEIFSVLAFLGTIGIGFLYRRGLLPIFTKAVGSIGESIGNIKEEGERISEASGAKIDSLTERLSEIESSFSIFSSSLSSLESKLQSEEAAMTERQRLSVIMNSQVELLYDIFMSSSLPEYKKEAVGAKILKMREELGADDARKEK